METPELIVWSAMLGGLLTLATVALADALMNRNAASWRGLIFVVLTGTSCVVTSGLAAVMLPDLPPTAMLVLRTSQGPLCGALALTYLGMWLGTAGEDRLVHTTLTWGSMALVVASATLAVLAMVSSAQDHRTLIAATGIIKFLALSLALVATVRAAVLGDTLARSMLGAEIFLGIMMVGLYTHWFDLASLGLWIWVVTAFCTVVFFLLVTALGIRRNRFNRKLERLAGLAQGSDPATGLPTGSVLLSKIDDAFWRGARLHRECTVICLHLSNLYELGEAAGHTVDQQILSAMAARMRRAVGFRSVVGLYHPRCFVVVVSSAKQAKTVADAVLRLRYLMGKPLNVVGADDAFHTFTPHFSIGVVTVDADHANPASTVDRAEGLALASQSDADAHPAAAQTPTQF